MHPGFKKVLTRNKLTSTSLFFATQISIGSTSCVTGLEKISTNVISMNELPRTLSKSLLSIPERTVTDNTPPGETELGIITTPTVFPLESLRTRLVIDEFSPSTIAKVSGSHSSFSLQSLAEVGMNVELGDGEITSGGNISTGGRMMRDSLGVIEMDRRCSTFT